MLALLAALVALAAAGPAEDAQFIADWCALVLCFDQANYCSGAATVPAQFVECDSDNRIIEVVYDAPGQASIPPSIGALDRLQTLKINVQAPAPFVVPPEISNLASTLTKLQIVGVGSSDTMAPLPGQISALDKLDSLLLSRLTFPPGAAFPPTMGELSSLRTFSMVAVDYQNEFPPTFASNWQKIEVVQFFLSQIQTALPVIGNKPLLRFYNVLLVQGSFAFADPELFFSPNLQTFQIIGSAISGGNIPPIVYQAPSLGSLVLSGPGDLVFELDGRIGQMASLERLSLVGTDTLSGTLPSEIGQAAALEQITIDSTAIGGTLPSELGRLSGLTSLRILEQSSFAFEGVADCAELAPSETLTGTVPQEVVDLLDTGALESIFIKNSCIGGEIPAFSRGADAVIEPPTEVTEIEFGGSRFSGALPAWLREYAYTLQAPALCDVGGNLFCFKPKPYGVDEIGCSFALNGELDECGVCEGDSTACLDCAGVLHGPARRDLCGVCGGANACLDCAGTPDGGSVVDACGVCRGDNSTCAADCAGTPHGTLELDECGVCGGDNACLDCAGVPFGMLVFDRCGLCGGTDACVDCADEVDGGKVVDVCGQCVDVAGLGYAPQCYDCAGVPNGDAVRDLCGNCPASAQCKVQSLALTQVLADSYAWLFGAAGLLLVAACVLAVASGVIGALFSS